MLDQERQYTIKVPRLHLGIVKSDAQHKVLVAGRRFGKTQCCVPLIFKHLTKQFYNRQTGAILPHKIGYYAPTLKGAEETVWGRVIDGLAPIIAKIDNTKYRITFQNGGTFQLFGTDMRPESLRGAYRTLVIMDEFAYQDHYTWREVVSPMLADVNGESVFLSTPEGHDLFYDYYQNGLDPEMPNWESWCYTSLEGGYASPEYLEEKRKEHTEEEFERIYEAKFVGKSGRIYYAFDKTRNVTSISPQEGMELHWSWDFNQIPCVHSTLGHKVGDSFFVFDEICVGETPDTVKRFMEKYPPGFFSNIKIYGDATKVGQTTSGISDYDVMSTLLAQGGYGRPEILVFKGNPQVRNRTNHVNKMLKDANGRIHLMLDKNCNRLIRDFEKLARSDKSGKIDKVSDPELSHASDALGYCLIVALPPKYNIY